jgi:DNA-binding Lrp family transcriptional regulator
VLICLDRDPEMRLRDVASAVGITERAAQRIVKELEEATAITRHKVGRRNVYAVNKSLNFRHDLESNRTIGDLLVLFDSE